MTSYSFKHIQYITSGRRKSIDWSKLYRHNNCRLALHGIANRFKFYGGF